MSIVSEQVKAGVALVSNYEGAMKYLKGVLWDRFEFWLERMADLQMTDVEAVRIVAQDYLGANLNEAQCESVKGILGLEAVVKSYKDASAFLDFEKAIAKNPAGMKTEMDKFITSAKHNMAMEIVHAHKAKIDNGTFEEKIEAYVAFGYEPKRAEELAPMSGIPVDLYSQAGVSPDTFEVV